MNNGSDSNISYEHEGPNLPDLGERPPIRLCLVVQSALNFASTHGLPVKALCGEWVYADVLAEAEAAAAGAGVVKECLGCRRALALRQSAGAA